VEAEHDYMQNKKSISWRRLIVRGKCAQTICHRKGKNVNVVETTL
jgi:hypothetical protein